MTYAEVKAIDSGNLIVIEKAEVDAEFVRLLGYDEATASHFAVLLGDTPLSDRAGNYIVMDGGKQLAILPPLAFFQEPD